MIIELIFSSAVIKAQHTLDAPTRDILLKPRNFHPYGKNNRVHHFVYAINLDYINPSVYNNGLEKLFPARHPSNGIFRF